jgi:hypothetical protein
MATFRYKPLLICIAFSLACMSRDGAPEAAPAPAGEAKIQHLRIEHLVPRRDAVGPTPARFEWSAADGIDSYEITVENEIEIPVFEQIAIKTTSVPWPPQAKVDPGTYYWRVVGMKGDRIAADSGRAAFVVLEP